MPFPTSDPATTVRRRTVSQGVAPGRPVAAAFSWLLPLLLIAPSAGSAAQVAAGAQAEGEQSSGPLAVLAIEVEPARVAADTLCSLTVRLENRGERPIYALAFEVLVGGAALPVYRDQLFLQRIPSGETSVELFNFWSSETGRPLPAGEHLEIEVAVLSALFLDEATGREPGTDGGDGGEGEAWRPGGAVPELPTRATPRAPLERGGESSGGGG